MQVPRHPGRCRLGEDNRWHAARHRCLVEPIGASDPLLESVHRQREIQMDDLACDLKVPALFTGGVAHEYGHGGVLEKSTHGTVLLGGWHRFNVERDMSDAQALA